VPSNAVAAMAKLNRMAQKAVCIACGSKSQWRRKSMAAEAVGEGYLLK